MVGSYGKTVKAMLQWGHAFAGVETEALSLAAGPEDVLQWGHAFAGVETGPDGSQF